MDPARALVAIVAFAAVTFGGAVLWRRRSEGVRAALASGDDAAVSAILSSRSAVLQSRIENVLVATVVLLMVLRPG